MACTSSKSHSAQQNFRSPVHGRLNGSLSTDAASSGNRPASPLQRILHPVGDQILSEIENGQASAASKFSSVLCTALVSASVRDSATGGAAAAENAGLRIAGEPSAVRVQHNLQKRRARDAIGQRVMDPRNQSPAPALQPFYHVYVPQRLAAVHPTG